MKQHTQTLNAQFLMGLLTDKNMTKTEKQRILGSRINRGHMFEYYSTTAQNFIEFLQPTNMWCRHPSHTSWSLVFFFCMFLGVHRTSGGWPWMSREDMMIPCACWLISTHFLMHKDSTQILGFECGGVPLGIHYGKTAVAGVNLDYFLHLSTIGLYNHRSSNPGYLL